MNKPITKAVGVTFNNRQETLKRLSQDARWRSVTLIHTKFKNEETGIEEDAIRIIDYSTKEEIGWIPKKEVPSYKGIYEMTAEIGEYKDTMYCNLYYPKPPTRNQYWKIKRACERKGIKMPIYDVNAYEATFAILRIEKD